MERATPQPITDLADPRLDLFRDLIARGDRPDREHFFVESEIAVARLLASPHFTTLAVLGTPAHLERLAPACPTLACSRELLRAVLGFDLHRGVIACAARPPALDLTAGPGLASRTCPIDPARSDMSDPTCPIGPARSDMSDPTCPIDPAGSDTDPTCPIGPVPGASSRVDRAAPATSRPPGGRAASPAPPVAIGPVVGAAGLDAALAGPAWTVLLVQGLADPANLGSIVRSARAFAVDLVLLDPRGADPLARRAVRAAMGHVFAQPLALAHDLAGAAGLLRARGAGVWAATVGPRARPLAAASRPGRLLLMVGNEGVGLPEGLRAAADVEVTIPLAAGVDSLGVAAATAVLLHALAGARD